MGVATGTSAVDCRLKPPGGGGGGGRLEAGGSAGADPGIGGGGRLVRLLATVVGEKPRTSSLRGDCGGDLGGRAAGTCGGIGGNRLFETPACSRSFSLAPPESSSSDSDPAVGDLMSDGGGGGGARAKSHQHYGWAKHEYCLHLHSVGTGGGAGRPPGIGGGPLISLRAAAELLVHI